MTIRKFESYTPEIHPSAWVDATALVIGEVRIDADASVWPMSVVRGDIQRIEIGAGTNVQDGSVLHVTHDSEFSPGGQPLLIGNQVTVGHQVVLHGCSIGDHCLIGIGSIVMDGAVLENRVMLGAGSLVTPGKVLQGDSLWVGRPAQRVRSLTEPELAYLDYSATHYVRLKSRHGRP